MIGNKMILNLVDLNEHIVEAWKKWFVDVPDVNIECNSIFSVTTDAIVSPGNSFGFMDGGLDLLISNHFGWHIQERLQKIIKTEYNGELLVGQAVTIDTEDWLIPHVICAPTMRVPMQLKETINPYLAAKAIFVEALRNPNINSVSISGLCTLTGAVSPNICAKQMKKAYDDIILDKIKFPNSWFDSKNSHIGLRRP